MVANTAQITFKYLALPNGLGGRGGVQRFFLLANNIPFEENLVDMSEWYGSEKERVVKSNENPCGTVPILYTKTNDNDETTTFIQHIASARYFAHLYGITKENTAYEEYVQDLVADEYQGFRDEWVKTAFSGSDEDKAQYKTKAIPKYLTKFEALYVKYKTHEFYLSTSNESPLWGDAAMFGLLRDNILTGLVEAEDLEKNYPNLWSMYQAFEKIPAVAEWINSKK